MYNEILLIEFAVYTVKQHTLEDTGTVMMALIYGPHLFLNTIIRMDITIITMKRMGERTATI